MNILNAVISSGTGAFFAGVFGIILFLVQRGAKKKDDKESGNKEIKAGLCVLLYDRLKEKAKKHLDRGEITTSELKDFINMHEIYHNLGGNGYLDALVEAIKELKIIK